MSTESEALLYVEFEGVRPKGRRVRGVYFIDGGHYRRRIIAHVLDAQANRHINKRLQAHINGKIDSNQQITVRLLSDDPHDEDDLIREYIAKGYSLLNSLAFGRALKRS